MKMTNVGCLEAIKKEGDFIITTYPTKTELIQFCPKLGTCAVMISKEAAKHPIWQWNGDYENPSINPSIGCDSKCGKHITITSGNQG